MSHTAVGPYTWRDFIELDEDDPRELLDGPDVQFYRTGNFPEGQELGLEHGHPDLVIEVILPSRCATDRVQKRLDYAAIGVPEYWLIDPEIRVLERQVLCEGAYLIIEAIEGDAVFRPASFEGLEIELGRLWGAGPQEGSPP